MYGLQRSGTNYLKWILEQNFDVFILQNWMGWKHGMVVFLKEDETYWRDLSKCELSLEQKASIKFAETPRIAIKKNVYEWLVSAFKYKPFNWNDYKKMIDIYFEFSNHYADHCHIIEYDDLLFRPKTELNRLQRLFKLESRGKTVTECTEVMPRAGDDHSDSWGAKYANGEFNRNYYKDKLYMNDIPNLEDINEYLKNHEKKAV